MSTEAPPPAPRPVGTVLDVLLPIPSVSVCIPVFQGERYIAEAIRSVLDQTYRDFELVILDNAGSDATADIARSFGDPRIRVERNATTVPQADNWNRAVQLTRAPLVKVLCSDDLLHPRCLEFQVGPMEADPGLALVASRRHLIDALGRVVVPRRRLTGLGGVRTGVEVARRVVRGGVNPIGGPACVLFRREDFFAAGGWRSDRTTVMDLDLCMRLLQYGEFLELPETLAAFRIDVGSRSAGDEQAVHDEQKMLVDELAGSEFFEVSGTDRALGRLLAPVARVRRRLLFAAARNAGRKGDQVAASA